MTNRKMPPGNWDKLLMNVEGARACVQIIQAIAAGGLTLREKIRAEVRSIRRYCSQEKTVLPPHVAKKVKEIVWS